MSKYKHNNDDIVFAIAHTRGSTANTKIGYCISQAERFLIVSETDKTNIDSLIEEHNPSTVIINKSLLEAEVQYDNLKSPIKLVRYTLSHCEDVVFMNRPKQLNSLKQEFSLSDDVGSLRT